jgi:hypothetical protein
MRNTEGRVGFNEDRNVQDIKERPNGGSMLDCAQRLLETKYNVYSGWLIPYLINGDLMFNNARWLFWLGCLKDRHIPNEELRHSFPDRATGLRGQYMFGFLQKFVPDAEYDGEQIGVIGDALIDVLTGYHSMREHELYPWLLTQEKEIGTLL